MKMETLIEKKIRENAGVRINYKSTIDGQSHYIRGYLTGETKDSFLVEGRRYYDVVPILKKNIISMFFEKPKDQKPKPEIKPDPVISRSHFEQDSKFSYNRWWKDTNIQEGE